VLDQFGQRCAPLLRRAMATWSFRLQRVQSLVENRSRPFRIRSGPGSVGLTERLSASPFLAVFAESAVSPIDVGASVPATFPSSLTLSRHDGLIAG